MSRSTLLLLLLLVFLALGLGLKLKSKSRSQRRGGGLSVGAGRRRSRITVKPDTIDEVTTQVTDASPDLVLTDKIKVKVAIVLPHSMFMEREYKKQIFRAKSAVLSQDGLDFDKVFTIEPYLEMFHPIPAPTEVLEKICDQFLASQTAIIVYLTNSETYGRHCMASQYFLQLSQYLRIPVVGWNADNSGFEQVSNLDRSFLQLAPSLKHQVAAILTILHRYSWSSFSIITGAIPGHGSFEQIARDLIVHWPEHRPEMKLIDALTVYQVDDLQKIARTESRVFLLYSTKAEAIDIFRKATKMGLTGKSFMWIVTQAVIGSELDAPQEFPVGMLGVHFDTSTEAMIEQIRPAFSVLAQALHVLSTDERITIGSSRAELASLVQPNISCASSGEVKWGQGQKLYQTLRQVKVGHGRDGGPLLEFSQDGFNKNVELKIVNLQPVTSDIPNGAKRWEEVGSWKSWQKAGKTKANMTSDPGSSQLFSEDLLDIKDIVWPGLALKPPEGLPEKRFIRVTFLEEDPYVMLSPPSTCGVNKGVICQMVDDPELLNVNITDEMSKEESKYFQCCRGFCVDLLEKFSHDLSFDYKLVRVKDGKWGGIVNGQWNGLVRELIHHETDVVMTSLKINSGRESVIEFSVPFLETGITVLVAKRTGIISPTAFLEPFDTASWALVALVAIQVAAGFIFFFEWLSPAGYNMKVQHPQGRFSFLRTLWLVWAILFQAAVNVDCPRGYTSRFMAYTWATFALIFLAIYTANLAAFMITREEFPNLSGLEDRRLANPNSVKPPFRFGTIPAGATDYVIKNNFPNMHIYMKNFNRSTVKQGFKAVKEDHLDAFIYDATVLEYLVGQDDECNILTVGSWYAMTGYGVAFPKGSRWTTAFNAHLMRYRENGDLERMQRFWFTGACEPRKRRRTSSKPLALAQFMSAFLLLALGISLSVLLLFCEHGYFSYLRPHLKRIGRGVDWCSLISLSVAESIRRTKAASADDSSSLQPPQSTCQDPLCDFSISSVTRELETARERIQALQQQLGQVKACQKTSQAPGPHLRFRIREGASPREFVVPKRCGCMENGHHVTRDEDDTWSEFETVL